MTDLRKQRIATSGEKKQKGMYFSDRCQFCYDFGEKIEPYLCLDCKEKIKKLGYIRLNYGEKVVRRLTYDPFASH